MRLWHSVQKLIASARGANGRKVLVFARTMLMTAMIMKRKKNKEKLKADHDIVDRITADHERKLKESRKKSERHFKNIVKGLSDTCCFSPKL